MNVEFRCPVCHGRLFAAPTASGVGGKSIRMCPKDSCRNSGKDAHYVQTEAFGGQADRFAFVDQERQIHYANEHEAALAGLGEREQKVYLWEVIENLTGKKVDRRLSLANLRDELIKALPEPPAPDESIKTGAPAPE